LLAAVHRCYLRFEPQTRSRRKRFAITAALSAVGIAAIALGMWWYASARSSAQIERSIAVLPFQNLSPGNEDAFFTVGMQDEITGDLARLADMKVIGAQSARSYLPDKRRDLPVIGRELGVRYLLEGSVWRADGQMRVSLRLVDTRDSDHPWTETYERSITDVFALQSEIARAIATQLKTRLSPNETAALDLPPTSDLRAYDLYLEAHQIQPPTKESSISSIFSNGQRAIQLLNDAIARDPGFALAYCDLARWHDDLHFLREAGPPEELAVDHRGLAELALDKARRLDPDSGALHLELAIHALQINRNVEEAEIQVQLARRSLPNDAQVESIAGRVARRKDQWDEAVRCLERAVSLEPRDPSLRSLLAETYRFGRRYDDFARNMSVLIGLTPLERTGFLPIERALGELEHSADVAPLRTAFGTQLAAHRLDDDQISAAEMLIAVWSHDNGAISRLVAAKHVEIGFNGIGYPDAWFEALSARIRGDNPAAMAAFARARMQIEKVALSRSFDGNPLGVLAIIDAGLGHKEQAIEEAKRACDLSLFEANNLDAPTVRCDLAIVYAWTGESDLAISELTKLIDRAAGSNVIFQPTYGDFRLSPVWDPLRSDPRFQALVKRLAPTASN